MNKFPQLFRHCNRLVLVAPVVLSAAGIAAIASVSRTDKTFLTREVIIQSVALVIGLILVSVITYAGYRYFTDLEKPIYIFSMILLLSVYVPGLGTSLYGSRSWIDLGFITIQPSEPVKIFFIILMSSYLSRCGDSPAKARGAAAAALYAMPFILIVTKEDFGSGCVFCAIWIFMVFCSGLELRTICRLALVFVSLIPIAYFFMAGYQKDRIDAFLKPGDLSLPGNYQVWNAKVAAGSGGLFGKGFMQGTQGALGFLPVPESDFIFASFVEETGFFGGMLIIGLFAFFLFETLKIAKYAEDLQGTLIAAGLAGMFFFQAFENIAMNMGLMPVTGITLPFVSCGGSSLISAMMGVGLLLSVSCRQKL